MRVAPWGCTRSVPRLQIAMLECVRGSVSWYPLRTGLFVCPWARAHGHNGPPDPEMTSSSAGREEGCQACLCWPCRETASANSQTRKTRVAGRPAFRWCLGKMGQRMVFASLGGGAGPGGSALTPRRTAKVAKELTAPSDRWMHSWGSRARCCSWLQGGKEKKKAG